MRITVLFPNVSRTHTQRLAVTVIDQVNRRIKRETDGLGRLIKVTEQDSSGLLAQETTYSYSLLDKLALVNQAIQTRAYKYGAKGRLLYEKIPRADCNDQQRNRGDVEFRICVHRVRRGEEEDGRAGCGTPLSVRRAAPRD